jgi:hypothetical protein
MSKFLWKQQLEELSTLDGMDNKVLASLIKVTPTTISRWLNEKTAKPHPRNARTISALWNRLVIQDKPLTHGQLKSIETPSTWITRKRPIKTITREEEPKSWAPYAVIAALIAVILAIGLLQ